MKTDQFETLVTAQVIDRVTVYTYGVIGGVHDGWEVWAYSDSEAGTAALERTGNRIKTQRGDVRRWASLDKLWAYLVKSGAAARCAISIEQSHAGQKAELAEAAV